MMDIEKLAREVGMEVLPMGLVVRSAQGINGVAMCQLARFAALVRADALEEAAMACETHSLITVPIGPPVRRWLGLSDQGVRSAPPRPEGAMMPAPQPKPDFQWKVQPTGEKDAQGWIPYEVVLNGQVIARGKVKP
jgi:hypothetical protein